jgi:hypothetical protein
MVHGGYVKAEEAPDLRALLATVNNDGTLKWCPGARLAQGRRDHRSEQWCHLAATHGDLRLGNLEGGGTLYAKCGPATACGRRYGGDALRAQSDNSAAATAYREGLTIRRQLAARDPSNLRDERCPVARETGLYRGRATCAMERGLSNPAATEVKTGPGPKRMDTDIEKELAKLNPVDAR